MTSDSGNGTHCRQNTSWQIIYTSCSSAPVAPAVQCPIIPNFFFENPFLPSPYEWYMGITGWIVLQRRDRRQDLTENNCCLYKFLDKSCSHLQLTQWSINKTGRKMADLAIHPGASGPFVSVGVKGQKEVQMPGRSKLFALDSNSSHMLTCSAHGGVIYKVHWVKIGMLFQCSFNVVSMLF